jgi:leucyl-tRNA synthetase
MQYQFNDIEKKWQAKWVSEEAYKVGEDKSKPKYYVLDMFPYPSGAGLHVGHPLGYIASDVITRYKRHLGFNVLHPMGYDAFGLPAEQYAIQTGQHPAVTTQENSKRYREQLDRIALSFDWSREIKTCDEEYYKWTQSTFIELFNHWYNNGEQTAAPISTLIEAFAKEGNSTVDAANSCETPFSSDDWNGYSDKEQSDILQNYRLAYQGESLVNWCSALGTVLANDEVKDGLSERGGHPVDQKKMVQWCLRITAYTERLLNGLDDLDWSNSIKEIQRNWIGRSEGAEMTFKVKGSDTKFDIFTTRPDTLFGVTFMVVAPESDFAKDLTTSDKKETVDAYIKKCLARSERERMADTKSVTGEFTGAYCSHPFTGKDLPIYVADYVLGGYGTGAIMAVPAHDSRDYAFAKKMDLPIIEVVSGGDIEKESYDAKTGKLINSDFLDGLNVKKAISKMCYEVDKRDLGKKKINYKLRDAIFSRQRYWGEPIPIAFKDGIATPLEQDELPLKLPKIDKYLPTSDGAPPLGRADNWVSKNGDPIELSTMPGFAGSCAYYLRYCDPRNSDALISKDKNEYWGNVDLYIGGTEHATGHLLYSRFWNMFHFDIGVTQSEEPFKKLINQGMIQGRSNYVYRIKGEDKFVSHGLKDKYKTQQLHVDVNIVSNDELNIEEFRKWRPDYKDSEFILENDTYKCGYAVEKMSKSMYNVVSPDKIIDSYGADTLRLYEMFLGPVEQSKPWNTNGIDGVSRFLSKLWRLFYNDADECLVSKDSPNDDQQKILHTLIKKVREDMDNFSLNTSVAAFMIAVNDLTKAKCHSKEILEKLLICLSPFAPHIAEELWESLGHKDGILQIAFPELNEKYLVENSFSYPVSFNGKMRFLLELPIDMSKDEVEKTVVGHENSQKYLDGKSIKKVIVVPKKIVNIVVG